MYSYICTLAEVREVRGVCIEERFDYPQKNTVELKMRIYPHFLYTLALVAHIRCSACITLYCCTQNYFKKIWNFVEFLSTAGAIIEFLLQHTLIKGSDVMLLT